MILPSVMALLLAASGGTDTARRESITFILGVDEDPSFPMYQMAEAHFSQDPSDRTDHLVCAAHSFSEARNYLAEHPPVNGRPWGLVNLVIHGSGSGQMDVPLFAGESPATVEKLENAARKISFAPLPDELLDETSEIRMHGCALGMQPGLPSAVSRILGGSDPRRPLVRASRWYTCYREHPGAPGSVERFLSEGWTTTYPPGKRPSGPVLIQRLKRQCTSLNIEDALSRRTPRFPGDTFSEESPVRVRWTLVFGRGDELPVMDDSGRFRIWLASQGGLQRYLRSCGMNFDQFRWRGVWSLYNNTKGEWLSLEVLGEGETLHVFRSNSSPGLGFEDSRQWAQGR